ncbi:DUF6292 family protein [Nonomuraea sp. NPDC050536]|uniref:DUF6292 family protein n=1 Tax=Nonomuraea sp. NPDC050536 TaxID=3364366 RepID=UPI0037CC29D3
MTAESRADPRGYVEAVRVALVAEGIEIGEMVSPEPGRSTRMLGLSIDGPHFQDTEWLDLIWDEEFGWTVHKAFLTGGTRGRSHSADGLGLGLVPEPATVARYVATVLGSRESFSDRGRRYRRAFRPDPDLEAALSAYS